MPKVAPTTSATLAPPASSQQNRSIVIIGSLFFIFGFVTWLNSVLIPYLKIACELTNFEAYLVTFAFYISYLVMAIPSAWVLKATGFKKGMSAGLLVMGVGALLFVPAALTRTYGLFLLGLFVQGTGLAVLQTAANPYITILGPRESAAKRISIMGICNKVAGTLAPVALGSVALKDADVLVKRLGSLSSAAKAAELDALAARVIIPYLLILAVLVLLATLIFFSSLPEIDTDHEDEAIATANNNKSSIFHFPHLLLGAIAMFFYVGVEVIAGDTIISYGSAQGFALSTATLFASCTLGAMILGYVIGIVTIPRYISQEKALQISTIAGVLFTLGALFTNGLPSVIFISLLGLANSLVFPAIWPLAIADLGRFTKLGSSLLVMALSGGAALPLLYALLATRSSPQHAYWLVIPCYLFLLFYGTAGHKIRRA
jgi:FHS family L-fucose permease-like MFS transporter